MGPFAAIRLEPGDPVRVAVGSVRYGPVTVTTTRGAIVVRVNRKSIVVLFDDGWTSRFPFAKVEREA